MHQLVLQKKKSKQKIGFFKNINKNWTIRDGAAPKKFHNEANVIPIIKNVP